ncbi:hypothetical protein FNU76_04820 [Chitinimonas arctica]|uniref:Uncharacterized protein n=1 Tax=Chitinimonas arctica TaxID=2594795 RepID=A0A516SC56_9NEIS|nr:hypothetical protein [Chitinimonas arctica]QDQ25725.1 hypothetical protein FNU76_04820 [Chitinimonas arctica]
MDGSGEGGMKMKPGQDLTLQSILQIEDTPEYLSFQCRETDILLWPIIRLMFIRTIMSSQLYRYPLYRSSNIQGLKAGAFSTLARSAMHNLRKSESTKGDICIMATAVGSARQQGRWFNRLSDHFAMALPEQTVVIEGQFGWEWKYPREFKNVLWQAPLQAKGIVLGHLLVRSRHRKIAAELIDLARQRSKQFIDFDLEDSQASLLENILATKIAALPNLHASYMKMLKKCGAKLLLKEEGCYGQSAVVNAAAHSLGMVTAEYQHGFISAGHDAYNYAETLRNSTLLRRTLPNYFLAYGSWWNDQINLPVTKLVIGNPYRSERLAVNQPVEKKGAKALLVIGDGVQTEKYLALARELTEKLSDVWTISFRPHPLERAAINMRMASGLVAGVQIDTHSDLYRSLSSVNAIVSELSTVLFEAVGIVEKIFVWETAVSRFSLPKHPFFGFDCIETLVDMMSQECEKPSDSIETDAIWAPNWRANYLDFVDRARKHHE